MKKTASLTIGLLFMICALTPVQAEDTVHVVKKGDTLWAISKQYLETPWKWPVVWATNDTQVTNPHRIFPGDRVIISKKDGKTTITIIPAAQGEEPTIYTPQEIAAVKDKSILISPHYSTFFLSPNELTGSGSVLKNVNIGELASKNESILIKSSSGLALGKGVTIVSKISEIRDKNTVIGYLYKAIAIASIEEGQSDIYKAKIAYTNQEVKSGDLIFDDLKPIQPLRLIPLSLIHI